MKLQQTCVPLATMSPFSFLWAANGSTDQCSWNVVTIQCRSIDRSTYLSIHLPSHVSTYLSIYVYTILLSNSGVECLMLHTGNLPGIQGPRHNGSWAWWTSAGAETPPTSSLPPLSLGQPGGRAEDGGREDGVAWFWSDGGMCVCDNGYLNALIWEVDLFCHSHEELDCQLCGETSNCWSCNLVCEGFRRYACHSNRHRSHSCDLASWTCILRKGWSHYAFFCIIITNCLGERAKGACTQWSMTEIWHGQTVETLFAMWSNTKMMAKISWPHLSCDYGVYGWHPLVNNST